MVRETVATGSDCEVWSVNGAALATFLDLSTQWRAVGGIGPIIWLGLDYLAVDLVIRRRGLDDGVFDDLQVMERAALPILNERRE